ncbi:OLC1v1034223C3 [Oldenlandia corymbosa var. corymbosa]|uniref:Probable cytosolic iron-sulfur protein assembly protein CIAO1 homolog n=1 Tax=Oldenlandia corymbosa var. corymbosa TaxID=529605 RepID=A0AAV1CSX5_OLDCO|nr:OLC1v1034223C3 [Oldenlandia corymbosa var. corymbosa]
MSLAEKNFDLRELHKLEGHTDRVWCVSWKPGTGVGGVPAVLASCSGDKTVRIWEQNLATGSFECKAVLDETHTRTVRSCAWSPSGKMLATASFDATTALWEQDGDDYQCISTIEGHENEVKSVAWNASSTLLATCGRDKTVWLWEIMPGNECECLGVLTGHTQDVKMVQFHPNLDVIFSCSYDNSIKVWTDDHDDDWMCVQTLDETNNGHTSTVWALSFNATGDKMVTCSDDLTLKIWRAPGLERMQCGDGYAPWRHICTLSGYHDRTIFSVNWSRRDGIIASGAADDAIRLFAADGDEDEDKDKEEEEEGEDVLYDGPKYHLLLKKDKAHDMDVNCVQWQLPEVFHPSFPEKMLLASASDDGTIKIWELTSEAGLGEPTQ